MNDNSRKQALKTAVLEWQQRHNIADDDPLARLFVKNINEIEKLLSIITGRKVFDPNSNLVLPEFELRRWEVRNESPGWLFKPNEKFNGSQLLRAEPGALP